MVDNYLPMRKRLTMAYLGSTSRKCLTAFLKLYKLLSFIFSPSFHYIFISYYLIMSYTASIVQQEK